MNNLIVKTAEFFVYQAENSNIDNYARITDAFFTAGRTLSPHITTTQLREIWDYALYNLTGEV